MTGRRLYFLVRMVMRSVACLLVAALTGPAAVTAVCDMLCGIDARHTAAMPASSACHEHHADARGVVISPGAPACHAMLPVPTPVPAVAAQTVPAPGIAPQFLVMAAPMTRLTGVTRRAFADPPDGSHARPPLRI